jgi:hypothetical protein
MTQDDEPHCGSGQEFMGVVSVSKVTSSDSLRLLDCRAEDVKVDLADGDYLIAPLAQGMVPQGCMAYDAVFVAPSHSEYDIL